MDITTYHSSKGLECKVCILLNVDTVTQKKLLYVGMTRASEKLCIHSFSSKGGEIFNELHSLYEEMKKPVDNYIVSPNELIEDTGETFSAIDFDNTTQNIHGTQNKDEDTKLIDLDSNSQAIEDLMETNDQQDNEKFSGSKELDSINNEFENTKKAILSAKESESEKPSHKSKKTKFDLRSKIKKLTGLFSQDKLSSYKDVPNVEDELIEASSHKWIKEWIDYFEDSKKYKLNNTTKITYELVTDGYNIHEIAKVRNLKLGTIVTHLISLAVFGKEIPYRVVNKELTPNEQLLILDILKKNGFIKKRNIKKSLGDNFTYTDVDLMLALLISYNRNNQF